MDYVEFFYTEVCGGYPFKEDSYKIESQKVIDYLMDAGIESKEIFDFVENHPIISKLSYDYLPDSLWENSLLKKNKFYYNHLLHIVSSPPIWNPETLEVKNKKFTLEMKIKFTLDDLLNYYYKELKVNKLLAEEKKDKAAFEYLILKYKNKIKVVEPIDFILSLIGCAKLKGNKNIINVFDITEYEDEVYEVFEKIIAEATLTKSNHIIWR